MSDSRHGLKLQGVYYLITGIWPLLHYASFEAISGRKTDDWLVKTLGALIGANGLALLAGSRQQPSRETIALSLGSATVLAAADVYYVAKGRVRPVYLLDALAELACVVLVLRGLRNNRSS